MNLYVYEGNGVLQNHDSGMVVVAASTEDEAMEYVQSRFGYDETARRRIDAWDPPVIYPLATNIYTGVKHWVRGGL